MYYSYEEYLKGQMTMPAEEAEILHSMIIKSINQDEDALELYDDLINLSSDYVTIRSNWTTHDRKWKQDNDKRRTAIHDVLISQFDILARYLKSQGKDTSWRDEIGDNRKRIGDFACYLVYVHSLNGR